MFASLFVFYLVGWRSFIENCCSCSVGCNNLFISHPCTVQVGTKVDDYWEPGKALLQDPGKFLESLFKFDKVKILTCITST